MIAEMVHTSGVIDDFRDIYGPQGIGVSGGAAFGMYLAIAAAVLMAAGAAKHFMAAKKPA